MLNRHFLHAAAVLALAAFAGPSWADINGCSDSPENPTAVLALLGAGAAGLPWLRAQLATRFRKRGH